MEINKRIIQVLEESGKSAADFAEILDVPRSTISHIQSGRNKPSLEFLTKLKTAFPQYTWDWLISGAGEKLKTEKQVEDTEKKTPAVSIPTLFQEIESVEEIPAQQRSDSESSPALPSTILQQDHPSFTNKKTPEQTPVNEPDSAPLQAKEIIRTMLFYNDGTFESFTP